MRVRISDAVHNQFSVHGERQFLWPGKSAGGAAAVTGLHRIAHRSAEPLFQQLLQLEGQVRIVCARRARTLAGEWPLGLASGVTDENVSQVAAFVDYLIVGTSLKKSEDALRVDEQKVKTLREHLDALGQRSASDLR